VKMKGSLVALLTIAALSGCFPGQSGLPDTRVDLTPAELAGVWRERGGAAEMVFGQDGTFTATDLPYQEFQDFPGVLPDGFDPAADKLPGAGKWELLPPLGNSAGPLTTVYLHVRMLAGRPSTTGTQVRAERFGSGPVLLSFYLGDPDLNDKIVYEKVAGS